VLFNASEPNLPVNVDWLLHHSGSMNFFEKCFPIDTRLTAVSPLNQQDQLLHTITQHSTCGNDLPAIGSTTPNADDSMFGGPNANAREAFYLPNVSDADQAGASSPRNWTTYVHVYPSSDGGIMIQYWHLFSYNNYLHNFCPVVCKDQHGGDWDAQIQVQLNPMLEPIGAWFSRHTQDFSDGQPGKFVPSDQMHWINGTHPLVSADAGGHGAYASANDFCSYHQVNAGPIHINPGFAVWSDDGSASNLHQVECDSNTPKSLSSQRLVGGIVWNTMSGGSVNWWTPAGSNLTIPVDGHVGGQLVLLGQYNPGTENCGGACAGISPGTFNPANGASFIQYSGFWGDPSPNGAGFPPRGPVYQGYNSGTNTYDAWYNQASSASWQPAMSLLRECGLAGLTLPCGGASRVLGLGDSIAAGYGLGGAEGYPDNSMAYPSLLGKTLNPTASLPVSNYAVQGACTQASNAGGCSSNESVATQIEQAFGAGVAPSLVTLTVGADDLDFAHCLPAYLESGVGIPNSSRCPDSQIQHHLDAFKSGLDADLKDIQKRFPQARVVLTQYYNPFPPPVASAADACYLDRWIVAAGTVIQQGPLPLLALATTKMSEFDQATIGAQSEIYSYFQSILDKLNAAIAADASAYGAVVVPLNAGIGGHNLCAFDNNPYVFAPSARVDLSLGSLKLINYSNPGPNCPAPVHDPAFGGLPKTGSASSPLGVLSAYVNFTVNCLPHPTRAGQWYIAQTIADTLHSLQ
jgi:lysophospholipase L1-like esterase